MWNSPAFGLLGIGFYVASSIVVMTLIGVFLDRQFDTRPILTLLFLALGLVAGFYGAYVQLREVMRRTLPPPRNGKGR